MFANVQRIISYCAAVEHDYLDGIFGLQAPGQVAVYADAIPWKWNAEHNPNLGDPAVLEYVMSRVAEIRAVLNPSILITNRSGNRQVTPGSSGGPLRVCIDDDNCRSHASERNISSGST